MLEYNTVESISKTRLLEKINKASAYGWELVTVSEASDGIQTAYLKRNPSVHLKVTKGDQDFPSKSFDLHDQITLAEPDDIVADQTDAVDSSEECCSCDGPCLEEEVGCSYEDYCCESNCPCEDDSLPTDFEIQDFIDSLIEGFVEGADRPKKLFAFYHPITGAIQEVYEGDSLRLPNWPDSLIFVPYEADVIDGYAMMTGDIYLENYLTGKWMICAKDVVASISLPWVKA
jgi:hypothetical protein